MEGTPAAAKVYGSIGTGCRRWLHVGDVFCGRTCNLIVGVLSLCFGGQESQPGASWKHRLKERFSYNTQQQAQKIHGAFVHGSWSLGWFRYTLFVCLLEVPHSAGHSVFRTNESCCH